MQKIKKALISVSDKTGLEDFAVFLDKMGVELISTGGTAEAIRHAGIKVTEVSSYTGYPEMLDGRVKTLNPRIHGAILALREDPEHMAAIKKENIPLIDMVVVNLYPFRECAAREDTTLSEAIENIDIGGPAMLRAAAKNFRSVAAVSSPAQYEDIVSEMKETGGKISEETRYALAVKVFEDTSRYDSAIAGYLKRPRKEKEDALPGSFPEEMNIRLNKVFDLRYGENPHQRGAFYHMVSDPGIWLERSAQIHGKELSFNNILDLSSALEMVTAIDMPAVSIVKHSNPSGVAGAEDLEKAFMGALDCDRMSAFGGIMGLNRPVYGKLAQKIVSETGFFECIIAPGYDDDALDILRAKKNLRVIKFPSGCFQQKGGIDIKKVPGGVLLQDTDAGNNGTAELKVVTKEKVPSGLMEQLEFAWKVVRFVKSNGIVLCRGTGTVGIGAGQMSRVDSVITACRKAGNRAKGSVLASDAFFPKADSIEQAHAAGVTAVIQPGGSIRDAEVIDTCDRLGIHMVFTGTRHFRH